MKNKYLIVIGGPTASGKTEVAIEIAKILKTEIISADSRQFYREMNIGTAKPTEEELAAVPHHFINNLSIEAEYSAGDFERQAVAIIERLFENNHFVVMTGGSGLFIKAVCEGLDDFPEIPERVKKGLEEDYQRFGIGFLQNELEMDDPEYFAEVDINNPRRLFRALLVCRASGRPYSSFKSKEKSERNFVPIYISLKWDRDELYERIETRVDKMMEEGLLEEAKALYPKKELNALQTVGYQELFDHLDGNITLEEAVDLIKQNSRRYAKRQITWLRKGPHWSLFHPSELNDMVEFIKAKIRQNQLQG